MARFMPQGIYNTWQAEETNPDRIEALHARDPDTPELPADGQPVPANRDDVLAELLQKRRRQLNTFLAQAAKCVSKGHYTIITRHATSLDWIYDTIRQDFDIQQKGIHFLNVLDLKYDAETRTPHAFYEY